MPKKKDYLIVLNNEGETLNEKDFKYISPKLVDNENDEIELKVKKPETLKIANVTVMRG